MFVSTKITGAVAALALLAGCAGGAGTTAPVVNSQAIGAVLGAAAGGVAGAQFGSGKGQLAATIAGTILGGVVGSAIAQQLSEQGRVAASATTQQTLSTAQVGQAQRWEDPQTGIYGTVQPTSPIYAAPAPQYVNSGAYNSQTYGGTYGTAQPTQAYATSQSIECRDYQTTVFSNGQPEALTGTMCRTGPNQPWRPRT